MLTEEVSGSAHGPAASAASMLATVLGIVPGGAEALTAQIEPVHGIAARVVVVVRRPALHGMERV